MTPRGPVRVLLFIGSNLLLFSYKACEEGAAHDYSYSCTPVAETTTPPFLGFGEWFSMGIFLFVVASGFIMSALLVFTHASRSDEQLIELQLETRRKIGN